MLHASRPEARTTHTGLGIVLVDAVDRRVLPALALAATLPNFDVRAMHFSTDEDDVRRTAEAWMRLDLSWPPLDIEDVGERPLLVAVEEVVTRSIDICSRVVVIVPELDLGRWWQVLLHRGRGRRIARRLQSIPGVWTVLVPYSAR